MTSLEAAFQAFHAEHPEVYRKFCDYADEVIGRGFKQFSSDAIFHRVRWFMKVEGGRKLFEINNNHTPYYARMWMQEHPQWPKFFELRHVKEEAA
jgi:hypothetical protein